MYGRRAAAVSASCARVRPPGPTADKDNRLQPTPQHTPANRHQPQGIVLLAANASGPCYVRMLPGDEPSDWVVLAFTGETLGGW